MEEGSIEGINQIREQVWDKIGPFAEYMKEKEPWRDVRALFSGMRLRLWNFIKNMRILRIYMEFLYV